MEMKKILCAVDLQDKINPAVDYAKMLAKVTGASVTLAYVVAARAEFESFQLPVGEIATGMRNILDRSQDLMDSFIKEHFSGMHVEGMVCEGRPATKLVELAKELHADMLVMGTHAREGIDRLFFGSVAAEVVRASECPVLTIRPKKA